MNAETFEIMRNGNYFLQLRYEIDGDVRRVLLEGDARTKVLYEGTDEEEAIRIWKGEWAHYKTQKERYGD